MEVSVTVTSPVVPVTGVKLDKATATAEASKTVKLTATVEPADATDRTVTWTSSDTQVATVENGLVTALKAGRAVVTATSEGISATCTVVVSKPFSYGGLCMEAICSARLFISTQTPPLSFIYKLYLKSTGKAIVILHNYTYF